MNRIQFSQPKHIDKVATMYDLEQVTIVTTPNAYPLVSGVELSKRKPYNFKKKTDKAIKAYRAQMQAEWDAAREKMRRLINKTKPIQKMDMSNAKTVDEIAKVPFKFKKVFVETADKYGLNLSIIDSIVMNSGLTVNARFDHKKNSMEINPNYLRQHGMLRLRDGGVWLSESVKTFIHEFGHAFYYNSMSEEDRMKWQTLSHFFDRGDLKGDMANYMVGEKKRSDGTITYSEYYTSKEDAFISVYARFNVREDFAESFLYYKVEPEFLKAQCPAKFLFLEEKVGAKIEKGGPGSGNFGHLGRDGARGGSMSTTNPETELSSSERADYDNLSPSQQEDYIKHRNAGTDHETSIALAEPSELGKSYKRAPESYLSDEEDRSVRAVTDIYEPEILDPKKTKEEKERILADLKLALAALAIPAYEQAFIMGQERAAALLGVSEIEPLSIEIQEDELDPLLEQNDAYLDDLIDGVSEDYDNLLFTQDPYGHVTGVQSYEDEEDFDDNFDDVMGTQMGSINMFAVGGIGAAATAGLSYLASELRAGGYWHTHEDDRTCEGCDELDGQWMTFEERSFVYQKTECGRNCRCWQLFEPAEAPVEGLELMVKNGQNAYAESGLAGMTNQMNQKAPEKTKRPEKVVAIDYHGTINDKGQIIEEMRNKMLEFKQHGFKIIIYSAGFNNNPQTVNGIETFLRENDVPFDEVWQRTGKPDADCYIDDKSWNPKEKPIENLGISPEGKIIDLSIANKESKHDQTFG